MDITRLIERYLEGSLSDAEKRDVEERAAKDVDFRRLLELHRELDETISDEEFHDVHQKIQALLQSEAYPDESSSFLRRLMPFLKVAAVFLLFVGTVSLLRIILTDSREERIFRKYYEPYVADIITRSDDPADDLSEAIVYYNQNDYTDAFSRFSKITSTDPQNFVAWFYRGITCMQMNDFQSAINSFSAIPENWNNPYSEHRAWFLTLALLHERNTARAILELQKISNDKGYYSLRSDEILALLRE